MLGLVLLRILVSSPLAYSFALTSALSTLLFTRNNVLQTRPMHKTPRTPQTLLQSISVLPLVVCDIRVEESIKAISTGRVRYDSWKRVGRPSSTSGKRGSLRCRRDIVAEFVQGRGHGLLRPNLARSLDVAIHSIWPRDWHRRDKAGARVKIVGHGL